MVRRTITFCILCALLVGCVPGAPAQPKVSFIVWGDPAEKAAYEGIVKAFEQQQPTIDVEITHIPGQNDYRKRLAADFAAGQPADVVLLNYRRMPTFAAKGAIEPLEPFLERSTRIKEQDFYPEPMAAFRFNGTLMCIPQNTSSLVVYYNKQLFDQAGVAYPNDNWTWDDFLTTAQTLTKDVNGDGTIEQYGAGIEPTAIRLAPFIWQNGGNIVDNATEPTTLTLDAPEALAAAQWFVDLQVKHHVVPDAVAAESEDDESRFQNGRTAMLFDSRRAVPTLRTINTFDWDIAPLPHGPQATTILHSDAYCMSAKAANKEAVWSFIEFANSSEGQTIIARTGRTVPSLQAVAQSPAFLEPNAKPQRSSVFLEAIPTIRAVPTFATWEDVESILDNEIKRAFYGQASVADAMRTAQQNAAPFLKR
ncbi:MAG: sugar ABC transporter substrate-binding protein [Chloroflexota bacterium]|nr:sugar ABC transporter substrate-binding protein [Chloroflexota bacterium]PLS79996.1 MAG: sugar ABC transporter substrate-binding protein [Chloroflexota bacterium]